MAIILHAKIKNGIIETKEDLTSLGLNGENFIIEIKKSIIDELDEKLVPYKKSLIDECIKQTELGVDIE
ncbi:MAG: hypothetical protein AMQ74_00324 [Candidatus Methanofastidiosum methylothiophilum]|uniref:Uncharacterized protein n=1 Tax=Candidatus Methanofastidiosum methylothiophilum TaxID=1705564 RepID=A0A150J994_9EURY|nr:MAG: hypothetical protein AMQ74_00324 [Candidatus Methanofastidiosum methylthiophilus]NMC76318.1 hypothetical protein [Candidatus Methanofastidiosa archaeon]